MSMGCHLLFVFSSLANTFDSFSASNQTIAIDLFDQWQQNKQASKAPTTKHLKKSRNLLLFYKISVRAARAQFKNTPPGGAH